MAFEKGNAYGNRFSSTNQPAKSGRKPSLYKRLKEMTGKKVGYEMDYADYLDIIRWVMEQTPSQLEALVKKNKETPLWLLNVISAINADTRKGVTTTIDSLLDRVFGKAIAAIKVEGAIATKEVKTELTDEELQSEIAKLEQQLK